MKKAVLTGFEKFGNYAVNPTERLAREIDGKIVAGHKIYAMVFPVGPLVGERAVDYGKIIMLNAERINASAIISLGIASRVQGVRIEGRCTNWVENDKYCSLHENRKPLVCGLPEAERFVPFGRWNLQNMFREFKKASIPYESVISQDPGAYCCNALLYRTLRKMSESALGRIPFLMAHVPCTKETIKGMSDFEGVLIKQEQLRQTVAIMLKSYV